VPENGIVVAYCHHGIRSLSAANFLEQQGVTPVFSLAGGIDAWSLQVDSKVPRY
jgi:adenylyltransferase/sulfurtransferase